MSTPVREKIAVDIEAAMNAITVANGFNQTFAAQRTRRDDFSDVAPEDLITVIKIDEPTRVEPAACGTEQWLQKFIIRVFVIDSDKAAQSIETRENQVWADVNKKLNEDIQRDNNALNTKVEGPDHFDDGEFTGIDIPVEVEYRTVLGDPYTGT